MISDQVVIATILRAGLPFHQGFLNYFDDAQNAFVPGMENSRAYGDAASGDVFGLTVASFAAMIETP